MRNTFRFLIFVSVCLVSTYAVHAHDGFVVLDFSDFDPQEIEHEDAEPFKGVMDLTLTNTGTEAWGDFHFEIFQVNGMPSVENVHFLTEIIDPDDYRPRKDGNLVNFSVDNDVVGATLDLYFYDDPVLPTQTVNFQVYTDNTTDQVPYFGMIIYPTPVPEPGTVALIGLGIAALVLKRRKK